MYGFQRWHWWVVVMLWIPSTFLTYMATSRGLSPSPTRNSGIALATLGSISGPMTGALSRGMQGCCLRASLELLMYCLPALGLAAAAQPLLDYSNLFAQMGRYLLWFAAVFLWFASGIVSLGHALS